MDINRIMREVLMTDAGGLSWTFNGAVSGDTRMKVSSEFAPLPRRLMDSSAPEIRHAIRRAASKRFCLGLAERGNMQIKHVKRLQLLGATAYQPLDISRLVFQPLVRAGRVCAEVPVEDMVRHVKKAATNEYAEKGVLYVN